MTKVQTITFPFGELPVAKEEDYLKASVVAKVYYEGAFAGEIVEVEQFGKFRHIMVYGREGKDSFTIGGTDKTIEEGIESIKRSYESHLQIIEELSNQYDSVYSDLVKEFNVSKEAWLENSNIRGKIGNIAYYNSQINNLTPDYETAVEFIKNAKMDELPNVISQAVAEKVEYLRKSIEQNQKEVSTAIEHLSKYNDAVQQKLDGVK